jgi:hypothetical protein
MAKFKVLPYENYVVLRGNTNAVAKAYGPGEIVEIEDISNDVQRQKLELIEEDAKQEGKEEVPAKKEEVKESPASDGDAKARALEKLKGK